MSNVFHRLSETIWKQHTNKSFIFMLVFYTVCILSIISIIKPNIYPDPVRCFFQSPKELEVENSFQINVDTHFQKYFAHKNFSEELNETKPIWTKFSNNVYVFSAYVDHCETSHLSSYCIKFIGTCLINVSINMKCAFKTDNNFIFKVGFVKLDKLEEDHDKPYTAAYFYCSLAKTNKSILSKIRHASLHTNEEDLIWHSVQPFSSKFNQRNENVLVNLCVRPLYGFFSIVHLIEFISYYSVMGVNHFIFYKDKTSENMNPFFSLANNLSLSFEIIPWDIPLSNELIHEYGQIVFTQECITRSKFNFTHTLIVDIDEYIVPRKHDNLITFLEYLDNNYEDASNYVIPMVFFCSEYAIESSSYPLPILTHNKRQKTPWQHGFRSKYILKPNKVLHGGIHFIWKSIKGTYEVHVPDSLALVHHYRHCCGVQQTWFLHLFSFYVLSDEVVIDNTLVNKTDKILNYSLFNFIHISDKANVKK